MASSIPPANTRHDVLAGAEKQPRHSHDVKQPRLSRWPQLATVRIARSGDHELRATGSDDFELVASGSGGPAAKKQRGGQRPMRKEEPGRGRGDEKDEACDAAATTRASRSVILSKSPAFWLPGSDKFGADLAAASSSKGLQSAEELYEVTIETVTNPVTSRSKWEREVSGCLTPFCLLHRRVPACTHSYPRLHALGQDEERSSNRVFPSGLARKVDLHEWNQALRVVRATKHALLSSAGASQPTYRQPNMPLE
uniref:Uncharacterized protein n=1 Tax=Oryza punctata TaxID=4537 RepID=A0A0E0LCS3_ORYPU